MSDPRCVCGQQHFASAAAAAAHSWWPGSAAAPLLVRACCAPLCLSLSFCVLLEAERQANVEATQWTLHANQVSLLQLKETQADMLQQLKETKAERVVSAPQHLERKNEELARLRTQLDRQRNRNAMHRQRLDQLHDKLKDLELASAKPCTEDSPEIRSMRAIEGKLDQA
ncbi:hypothetical protein Esti_006570 [Eimeria stiedai]